jgi:hypothetical protein
MIRAEHTHLILTLLGLLALLLLAVSVASAGSGGWQEGEGVRYRTYRTPPPTFYPVAAVATAPGMPLVRVTPNGRIDDLTLWLAPGLLYDWPRYVEHPGPGPSERGKGDKRDPG